MGCSGSHGAVAPKAQNKDYASYKATMRTSNDIRSSTTNAGSNVSVDMIDVWATGQSGNGAEDSMPKTLPELEPRKQSALDTVLNSTDYWQWFSKTDQQASQYAPVSMFKSLFSSRASLPEAESTPKPPSKKPSVFDRVLNSTDYKQWKGTYVSKGQSPLDCADATDACNAAQDPNKSFQTGTGRSQLSSGWFKNNSRSTTKGASLQEAESLPKLLSKKPPVDDRVLNSTDDMFKAAQAPVLFKGARGTQLASAQTGANISQLTSI